MSAANTPVVILSVVLSYTKTDTHLEHEVSLLPEHKALLVQRPVNENHLGEVQTYPLPTTIVLAGAAATPQCFASRLLTPHDTRPNSPAKCFLPTCYLALQVM